jgi:hypothetical protein
VRRPPERSGFLRGPFPWDNSDWVCPIAALLQIADRAARLGDGGLARRRPGDVARGRNGYPAPARVQAERTLALRGLALYAWSFSGFMLGGLVGEALERHHDNGEDETEAQAALSAGEHPGLSPE